MRRRSKRSVREANIVVHADCKRVGDVLNTVGRADCAELLVMPILIN